MEKFGYQNQYYNRKPNGWNPCIVGNYPYNSNNRTGIKNANVLPNCVGFATARFNQFGNFGSCKYLGNTDAKNFIDLAKRQGLKIGTVPKVGACICWTGGNYGHVAIVEEVINENEIVISQSGWSYKGGAYWTAKHKKGSSGNWIAGDDYNWMRNYKFAGFIYQPEEKKEEPAKFLTEVKDIKILFNGLEKTVKGVYNNGTNYIRLRDIDDVLKLCSVSYDVNKKMPVIKR